MEPSVHGLEMSWKYGRDAKVLSVPEEVVRFNHYKPGNGLGLTNTSESALWALELTKKYSQHALCGSDKN